MFLSGIILIFILILLGIIFLTFQNMEIKWTKLYHFYLWIVSFVSLIAIWITLWVVLTSIWKYILINDEEYLQFRESYRLEQCKTPISTTEIDKAWVQKTKTPTEDEIKKCEIKVRSDVKLSRSYDLKDMFISSGAWFVVFLLFFIFHYPKFLKTKKED